MPRCATCPPVRHHQSGLVWAAPIAGNVSVLLQALTGPDQAGRAHGELLCVPARVIRNAGHLELRLPPGPQILLEVLA